MLDTGLRVGEVIQLRRFMLWTQGNCVKALSVPAEIAKLHRERVIPLSARLETEITVMHKFMWLNCGDSQNAFVFHTGDYLKHITARRIQQIVCAAGMATLGRRVWPHVLRHTFATRLMRVTNVRIVQELLGHRNLSSTQIYTHPNSQDLVTAIAKM